MGDGPDYKSIGLGVKDVIFGIATAAAGSTGGPAGAEGVAKAGAGLDKLIAMAPLDDNKKKKTPAEKMDQLDRPKGSAATPAASPVAAAPTSPATTTTPGPPPASPEEVASSNQAGKKEGDAWPPVGDARVTADHLSSLGWSRERIQKILGGPEEASIAQLTRDEPKGFKVAVADGTRIPRVAASPVGIVKAEAVPILASESTAIVDSKRAAASAAVKIASSSQVPIVGGRRTT